MATPNNFEFPLTLKMSPQSIEEQSLDEVWYEQANTLLDILQDTGWQRNTKDCLILVCQTKSYNTLRAQHQF